MKFTKILFLIFTFFFSSLAFATNIECYFDVRGFDMTERSPAILFEDSYEDQTLQTTSEACVITAIKTMKKYTRVQYKVKGKTFSYTPSGLHVEISIKGKNVQNVKIDQLNQIAESTQCVNTEKAFEYGSVPYSADFKYVDC